MNEIIIKITQEIEKAVPWLFSGLGILILKQIHEIYVHKKLNSSRENYPIVIENNSQPEKQEIIEESYPVRLGKRHKYLREKILELNERKMADFYGYDSTLELDKYERGEEEFPKESIEKLKETFFVNEKFLEDRNETIFRRFNIYSDEVKKLLQDGFKPFFLCKEIDNRQDLKTYPVFHKQEDNYSRIVVSNLTGSFQSTGGGYNNIAQIIKQMLCRRMRSWDALILHVNNQTWQELEQGTFYSKHGYFGYRDDVCKDIFDEWFTVLEDRYPKIW